jgi:hypothetical protein
MVDPVINIVPIVPGTVFPENNEKYVFSSPQDSAQSVDTSEYRGIDIAHLAHMFPDQSYHLDTTETTYGSGQGLGDQQQSIQALRSKHGDILPPYARKNLEEQRIAEENGGEDEGK